MVDVIIGKYLRVLKLHQNYFIFFYKKFNIERLLLENNNIIIIFNYQVLSHNYTNDCTKYKFVHFVLLF